MRTRFSGALALLLLGCGARTALDEPDAGAPTPPVSAERCDGLDDDGDGRIDEGLPPLVCGACEVAACVDGHPGMCPAEGTGAPELCNAIDDDCDGRVDEGLPFGLVGDPVVLRDVDEGSVGTCERCAHVIHATLQTMGGRLYAVWNFDYGGYVPGPTSFVRPLDDRGRPDGPPRPLLDVPITQIRFAPSHDGLTIASFCERDMAVLDHWRSAFFDADAERVGEIRAREHDEESCRGVPEVTWNGSTHFFARQVPGVGIRIETADATGRPLATESYEIAAEPRFARWGADVFLASSRELTGPDDASLRLQRFDRNAQRVDTLLLRPSATRIRASDSVLVEGGTSLLLLQLSWSSERGPILDGFFWELIEVSPDDGTSSTVGRIDLVGEPTSPDVFRRAPDDLIGAWTLRPDPLDRTAEVTEVMRFTSHGEELGRWTLPPGERTSDYVVRVHGGRVFVLYLREIERRRNRVELLELGCVP